MANDSLAIKWFLGLAVDEPAPDHSTLTCFKDRLIERGKLEAAEELLAEVIRMAREQAIHLIYNDSTSVASLRHWTA